MTNLRKRQEMTLEQSLIYNSLEDSAKRRDYELLENQKRVVKIIEILKKKR